MTGTLNQPIHQSIHPRDPSRYSNPVCGHEEVLEYLQGSGADLSAMDKNGATPLHYAVHGNDDVTQAKSLKMTRMLLEKGVKVDAVDEDGRTPLLWAASSGCYGNS